MVTYLRALLTTRLEQLDERGASAVEYGLLLAGVAVFIAGAVWLLGGKIKDLFTGATTNLDQPAAGS